MVLVHPINDVLHSILISSHRALLPAAEGGYYIDLSVYVMETN